MLLYRRWTHNTHTHARAHREKRRFILNPFAGFPTLSAKNALVITHIRASCAFFDPLDLPARTVKSSSSSDGGGNYSLGRITACRMSTDCAIALAERARKRLRTPGGQMSSPPRTAVAPASARVSVGPCTRNGSIRTVNKNSSARLLCPRRRVDRVITTTPGRAKAVWQTATGRSHFTSHRAGCIVAARNSSPKVVARGFR